MSKSCKRLYPGLFLLGAATAALVFAAPQTCAEALRQGLALCGGSLLVSLFPFLVVSALIMRSGAGEVLGVLLWPVVRCIGLRSRSAGSVLLIGLVGGFAPAAAAAAEAVRSRELTPQEASALLPACICSGPSFVILTVGEQLLGSRVLGELSDMVSQFEILPSYTQINYQGRPVRVTPLRYGDIIKWLNNRADGLPAYLLIDMVTQNVEVIRLDEGIHYTTAEHFSRNLYRHLRFHYPTYMFDEPAFEIDENGDPWWVCPRVSHTIGLFGGRDIIGAVLVNAVTGESAYYKTGDVPNWVDHVYTAELIMQQYDYHGAYVNGFINSLFGQRDVTVTTEGYNYIAIGDDVYMYTGVTSVVSDESNIGFILSNQRTKETRFYLVAGAKEYSAMDSAQGQVQQMKYTATFPLLLNISDQPTYFMALKDAAELVKMYAMVNVSQYQIVATGDTVAQCEANYRRILAEKGLVSADDADLPLTGQNEASGVLDDIRSAVVDGNTLYYLHLTGDSHYYVISAAAQPEVVIYNTGDYVTVRFADGEGTILTADSVTRTAAQTAPVVEETETDGAA